MDLSELKKCKSIIVFLKYLRMILDSEALALAFPDFPVQFPSDWPFAWTIRIVLFQAHDGMDLRGDGFIRVGLRCEGQTWMPLPVSHPACVSVPVT